MNNKSKNIIRPQEGFQMQFLSSKADIVIGGGAAGVGKTYALLLETLRHKDVKGFGTVCFRRTSPQITSEGGLWDTASILYKAIGGIARESVLEWRIGVSKVKFSHLEYEKNIYNWQGSQIPLILFDELTHFSRKMFFYMLTRNRSVCGINPYIRATCNPDPDSWLAEFISWWIDQETGFAIEERKGVIRYMVEDAGSVIWGDSRDEVIEKAWYMLEPIVEKSGIDPKELVKSVTFIGGSIYDNKELLKANPAYLGNLLAQDQATQQALLHSNWKAVLNDNDLINREALRSSFTNEFITGTQRYISADIALEGSDKFIVGVWEGWRLIHIEVLEKSDGAKVVDVIKYLAKQYSVPNHNIAYDADGVGGFIGGFIRGAREFKNNSKPFNGENYTNLKTQCYYKLAEIIGDNLMYIVEGVANKMYDDKMTFQQRIMYEFRALKKLTTGNKLDLIPKAQQKVILSGQSPDVLDMLMIRCIFEFKVATKILKSKVS